MERALRIGNYEVMGLIGVGGMSVVYKCRDLCDGSIVALKILKPEYSSDAGIVARFRHEAGIAAGVAHRNVVRIHEVGESDGRHFVSMEYVDGVSLSRLLRDAGGRLPESRALDILRQISRGVEAAHRLGIVHGDVKPGNILVARDGIAKITDFGRVATPKYASPDAVGPGSDVYSLGVVCFEMLTGALPAGAGDDPRRLIPATSADAAALVARMIAHG